MRFQSLLLAGALKRTLTLPVSRLQAAREMVKNSSGRLFFSLGQGGVQIWALASLKQIGCYVFGRLDDQGIIETWAAEARRNGLVVVRASDHLQYWR